MISFDRFISSCKKTLRIGRAWDCEFSIQRVWNRIFHKKDYFKVKRHLLGLSLVTKNSFKMQLIITKLTDSSCAVALLRKMFQDGGISPKDTLKLVWEQHFIFMRHKQDNFWAKTSKIMLYKREGSHGKFIQIFFKRYYNSPL